MFIHKSPSLLWPDPAIAASCCVHHHTGWRIALTKKVNSVSFLFSLHLTCYICVRVVGIIEKYNNTVLQSTEHLLIVHERHTVHLSGFPSPIILETFS